LHFYHFLFADSLYYDKMNFSIGHQKSQWREELKAIFATFRAAKLSREGRDAAVAALEALLANVQSLPPACMDTELELGQ
jgi:hypothetical protein